MAYKKTVIKVMYLISTIMHFVGASLNVTGWNKSRYSSADDYVPQDHLLRSIDRFVDLFGIRQHLVDFYSHTPRRYQSGEYDNLGRIEKAENVYCAS
jgi:hypothetical protein